MVHTEKDRHRLPYCRSTLKLLSAIGLESSRNLQHARSISVERTTSPSM